MARKTTKPVQRVYELVSDADYRWTQGSLPRRLRWLGRAQVGDNPVCFEGLIWSPRAAELLGPLLAGHAEFAPVKVSGTPMVLVDVLERDCVDRGASLLVPWGDGEGVKKITSWAFRSPPPIIFRVPELPLRVLCTDELRKAVKKHGLKGFIFDPLPMKRAAAKKKPVAKTKKKKKPATRKKTPVGPVTLDALRAALRAAADRFLAANRKALEEETPYAFLFEVSDQSFHAHGALATEERLARFADGDEGSAAAFRWGSTEEGGWIQGPDAAFREANALLQRAVKAGLFQLFDEDGAFEGVLVDVLRDLAADGAFGKGAKVALGVCDIGGPEVPRDLLASVKAANPPAVAKRVQKELRECDRAQGEVD